LFLKTTSGSTSLNGSLSARFSLALSFSSGAEIISDFCEESKVVIAGVVSFLESALAGGGLSHMELKFKQKNMEYFV